MGQKMCCLRASAAAVEDQPRVINPSSKTRNLREDNRTRDSKKPESSKKMMTLEECLKNSPALPPPVNHRPHPKKRVYPSTSPPNSDNVRFSTPRLSFSSSASSSLLLPGKDVEAAQPCRSYGRREKSKKKVTFRLPEEDDIILFYSPKQALDTMIEMNE